MEYFRSATVKCGELKLIGQLLDGRFTILELVSESGVARVYKARHELLARYVSIKFFKTDLFGEAASRTRFERESKALSALNHPTIVKIFDSGMSPDGEPYLVIDFLEGQTLSSEIAHNGPMAARRVIEIFSQVCDGLVHAHQNGVIHTALSPDSIFLTAGEPELAKIVDFGMTRLLSLDNPALLVTQTVDSVAKPRYMSPEQCVGRTVDARSDVYSLACVMYEALTGSPPYKGDVAVEIVSAVISPEPVPPPAVSEDSPESRKLVPVMMKALKKNAGERYQSMKDFKAALDACRSVPQSGSVRASTLPATAPRKTRVLMTAGCVSAIAALALWLAITGNGHLLWCQLKFSVQSAFLSQSDPRWGATAEELLTTYENKRMYGEAAEILKKILPAMEAKNKPYSTLLINNKLKLATMLLKDGRTAEAKKVCDGLMEVTHQRIRELNEKGRRDLADEMEVKHVEIHDLITTKGDLSFAEALDSIGRNALLFCRFDRALPYLLRAYEIRRSAPAEDPFRIARTEQYLGWAYEGLGKLDEAYKYLSISWPLAEKGQPFEDTTRIPVDLAIICRDMGRLSESESWYKKGLGYAQSFGSEVDPNFTIEILNGLGNVFRLEKKYADAQKALQEAITAEKVMDHSRKNFSVITLIKPRYPSLLHCDLAAVYADEGKSLLARQEYDEALKLAEASRGIKKDPKLHRIDQYPNYQIHTVLTAYASFLEKEKKYDEAEELRNREAFMGKKAERFPLPWPERPLSKFW